MTHKGGRLLSTLVCFLFSYLTLTKGYGYPDDDYFFLKLFDASRKSHVRNPMSEIRHPTTFVIDPKKLVCGLVFRAQNPETALQFVHETTILPLSLCSPADGCPIFRGQNAK